MTQIPDSLRLLFETSVEADGDRYVVPIPDDFVENGSLSEGDLYRVALLASENEPTSAATEDSVESTAEPSAVDGAAADSGSTADNGSTGDGGSATTRDETTESSSATTNTRSTNDRSTDTQSTESDRRNGSNSGSSNRGQREPPVEEGEVRRVAIDTLGDQGDGIARVERGFIVIVPGTQPGDDVEVEITDVKDTVAFAEPIGEAAVR